MKRKVLVAMSGGVDSSVAAFLLKEAGYEVTGMTMCLGIKSEGQEEKAACCGPDAIEDAKQVCAGLGIDHYVMDFSKELETMVIDKFIAEYLKGRTPNPCIDCNRHLKFGTLLQRARLSGFDYLATGHYAKIDKSGTGYCLKRPKDKVKDQTYFLYCIKSEAMESILFPLADLTKKEVREIARKTGLPVAEKQESQDLCFVRRRDSKALFPELAKATTPGPIMDIEGNLLGQHKGIAFYTIGQRKGLGIASKSPLYVIGIDAKKGRIVVGNREALRAKGLIAVGVNILEGALPPIASARIRYRSKMATCRISAEGNTLRVIFNDPQEAITPGQSVVFYDSDRVVGGAVIKEVLV